MLAITVIAVVVASGCGDDEDSPTASGGTVREELGQAVPANAPGQRLYLERVTIGPSTQLDTHFHDGTQVAHIESGSLTYDIVSGTAQITRSDGAEETLEGPTTTKLEAGDWIVETRDLIHYGSNETDEPVVVLLAVLLSEDAPLATPVDD